MEIIFDQHQKVQDKFSITDGDCSMEVRRHCIKEQVIFHVTFEDGRAPLILTRATGHDQSKFWTSVPQGRQKEATAIGPLIAEFILSLQ